MVRWRQWGDEQLVAIDVRRFEGDSVVIHFGGKLNSVDAYTFANSLIAFADTLRAVNAEINPSQDIDVRLDAVGPGSFKAVVKQIKKGLGGLFKTAPYNVLWIIAALYIENSLEGSSTIKVSGDEIVIQRGNESIIISRDAFEQYEQVKTSPEVLRQVSRTFEVVDRDEAIENFGLSPSLEDEMPLVQIPRNNFSSLATIPRALISDDMKRRPRIHKAILVVLKPWINASNKKWSFEWNGVPMSAYVRDEVFLEKIRSHEIRFGNGDALEVELEVFEDFDEDRGIWITDSSTYIVKHVHNFMSSIPSGRELGGRLIT